ncbi:MAG TPA: hypothetical protein VEH31_09115, partial [Streptosporangiaceae bacterium]|nr:hypothetical protein [Streptosporangiaceae bacterium]
VGIGVGLGTTRRQAPLRGDLARFCALLAERGAIGPGVRPGPVTGGWLRMGGTGTPAAAGNVLLVGDAAGLINPLQGEGIAPGMVSARLAAEAVLAHPADPGPAYGEALDAMFGGYLPGAAALQTMLLRRPRAASAGIRLLTAPGVRRLVAGTWSLYWNGLVDGAEPRPSAWSAGLVQRTAGLLAKGAGGRPSAPRPRAVTGSASGRPGARAGQR